MLILNICILHERERMFSQIQDITEIIPTSACTLPLISHSYLKKKAHLTEPCDICIFKYYNLSKQ